MTKQFQYIGHRAIEGSYPCEIGNTLVTKCFLLFSAFKEFTEHDARGYPWETPMLVIESSEKGTNA